MNHTPSMYACTYCSDKIMWSLLMLSFTLGRVNWDCFMMKCEAFCQLVGQMLVFVFVNESSNGHTLVVVEVEVMLEVVMAAIMLL